MNVSRIEEDDDDDEWCGGHGHCMPLLMMNSPLMQMMQHDRVSLLNNPSRKINQHGRGQSTFIRQMKEKSWQRQHHKWERVEHLLLAEIILFAINGCVTYWASDMEKGYYYLRIDLYSSPLQLQFFFLSQNQSVGNCIYAMPRPSYT